MLIYEPPTGKRTENPDRAFIEELFDKRDFGYWNGGGNGEQILSFGTVGWRRWDPILDRANHKIPVQPRVTISQSIAKFLRRIGFKFAADVSREWKAYLAKVLRDGPFSVLQKRYKYYCMETSTWLVMKQPEEGQYFLTIGGFAPYDGTSVEDLIISDSGGNPQPIPRGCLVKRECAKDIALYFASGGGRNPNYPWVDFFELPVDWERYY